MGARHQCRFLLVCLLVGLGACQRPPAAVEDTPGASVSTYEVVQAYPHDPNAFTQGLVISDDALYESTGRHGESTVRKVVLQTGEVVQTHALATELWGEGLTLFEDRLIQLTWQARRGFVYQRDSFELEQEFAYPTEGWGITHDGQRLIMSDGTATLYFLDPNTLSEISRISIHDRGRPVDRLNELEYVEGEVYANIWLTDRIARIAPDTGQVVGWIDLEGLLSPGDRQEPVDVLNGIAYDPKQQRLFVTGKLWPKLFEIRLVPTPTP